MFTESLGGQFDLRCATIFNSILVADRNVCIVRPFALSGLDGFLSLDIGERSSVE